MRKELRLLDPKVMMQEAVKSEDKTPYIAGLITQAIGYTSIPVIAAFSLTSNFSIVDAEVYYALAGSLGSTAAFITGARIIAGYEKKKNDDLNLLIRDPSQESSYAYKR